jgi:hypothetical protein
LAQGSFYKLTESGIGGKTYVIKSMYTKNKCVVQIGNKQTGFFPSGKWSETGLRNMSNTI